jgi:hypothetical protein
MFQTIGSQMAVRLSAFRAGLLYPSGRFLVLISVRSQVNPKAIVQLEGFGQLKNPMISSVFKPATFRLVAFVTESTTLPHAPNAFVDLACR